MLMRFFQNLCLALLIPSVSYSAAMICPPDATNTAVFIIDMQPAFVNRIGQVDEGPNKVKFDKLIEEQQALIAHAKFAKLPIVYIETESSGATFESLTAAAKNYANTVTLSKTSDGMLEEKSLHHDQVETYLEKNKIGRLIVAGVNAYSCVSQSMYGALAGNCSVLAYIPGIADLNRSTIKYRISYVGKFDVPRCKSCKFKEVVSLDELSEIVPVPASSKTQARPEAAGNVSNGAQ
jgi:nicotinamidase-related amidase